MLLGRWDNTICIYGFNHGSYSLTTWLQYRGDMHTIICFFPPFLVLQPFSTQYIVIVGRQNRRCGMVKWLKTSSSYFSSDIPKLCFCEGVVADLSPCLSLLWVMGQELLKICWNCSIKWFGAKNRNEMTPVLALGCSGKRVVACYHVASSCAHILILNILCLFLSCVLTAVIQFDFLLFQKKWVT